MNIAESTKIHGLIKDYIGSTLLLSYQPPVLTITLNRPEKHNALNQTMVDELLAVFVEIAEMRSVRAVILRSKGKHFCAGGDIGGMQDGSQTNEAHKQQIRTINRRFGELCTVVNAAPQVVVAVLQGAVMGGGLGLACAADIAIADQQATFSMPETSLGVVPAQIAPFVMQRIGQSQTRRLALLGERIKGEEALRIGLVHIVTHSEEEMQSELHKVVSYIKCCAPKANATTKHLLQSLGGAIDNATIDSVLDHGADVFAERLFSDEGKEGTAAFIEKRKPSWTTD
ncbi:enoyl-CoA hydratase-related protein [SAR92 clade bacterium H231]|nr:enoyl-CoA hydratase-related protein [SAR92 clade bacterium H231]